MAVTDRVPRLRLRRWPTADWERTHVLYRFIRGTFRQPIDWAARIHARGVARVPDEGGVILAVNHLSWADPVVLGAALRRPVFWLAKQEVFRNPVAGRFFTIMGQIKVDRATGGNEPAVESAKRVVDDGRVLGVFPEGTRSRPGHIKRGKTGVARIAAVTGAPVVPIGLDTGDFWPKSRALPHLGEKVYLNVGEPMRFDLKPSDADDRQRMREVTDHVMDRVRALYGEAVAAHEAGEAWE